MKYIKERLTDFDANKFINELSDASKYLGILEAKIDTYKFNTILIPMFQAKEASSSMNIEGTQTTITDIFENQVTQKPELTKISIEVNNHQRALAFGADFLRNEPFTHTFMHKIHEIMLKDIISKEHENTLGKYKTKDNKIVNSVGTTIYNPPTAVETKKYMDELIAFMNDNSDSINPLIKAAIIHSQFESIHPFSDGNGRVGRLLVSLYLFKAKVINFPFFYISEAINMDKSVYYNMLTDSRNNTYDEWLKYFLRKIYIQTRKHISYIDALNELYNKTKKVVQENINSPKFDAVIDCIFTHPVINAEYLADRLTISHGQAVRYLNTLEKENILKGNDRKRKRTFYFAELFDIAGV